MRTGSILAMVGHSADGKRVKDDFYATSAAAASALFDNEQFPGGFWEPACGDGAICKVAAERGYDDITASDKIYRGYGEGGIDFTRISPSDLSRLRRPNIITNPPFSLSCEFMEQALKVAKKVAIFNKLSAIAGQRRYRRIFSQGRLRRIYVFCKRPAFARPGEKEMAGLMEFAWFVWDDQKTAAAPELFWISGDPRPPLI